MNTEEQTTDPICGMTVDPQLALSTSKNGEPFYFCSQHCLDKFNDEPDPDSDKAECCHGDAAERKPHHTGSHQPSATAKYYCPMCEGVESDRPGDCPKCGMALEPTGIAQLTQKTIYTCPMHPEVGQDKPGACPICGMDLEPKFVTADVKEDDTELNSMTCRFWIAVALSVPVFLLAMLPMLGVPIDNWFGGPTVSRWIQFALATPVVLWCGWPFFVRGWRSILTWNLNMFTLISLGVGAAYIYSTIALLFPHLIGLRRTQSQKTLRT